MECSGIRSPEDAGIRKLRTALLLMLRTAVTLIVVTVLAADARAECIHWILPDDTQGAWHDPANWSTGTVPGPADTAVFNIWADVILTQDVEVGAIEFAGVAGFAVATLHLFGHKVQVNGPIEITDNFIVFGWDGQGAVITCTDWLLANGTWSMSFPFPNITVICDSLTIDDGSAETLTLFRAWILECPLVTVGENGIFALHHSMTGSVVCGGGFWPDSTTGTCNPSVTALNGDLTLLPGTEVIMSNFAECPRVLQIDGHAMLDGLFRLISGGPDSSSCDVFSNLITATKGLDGTFSEVVAVWPFTERSNFTATYRDDALDIQYYPLADVDRDDVVGILDLLLVLSNWGCEGGPLVCAGDIVQNPELPESVNILDLLGILIQWGETLCETSEI